MADEAWKAAFKTKSIVFVDGAIGNDTTGDGTFALPWATLGKANGDAPTPSVVVVMPGEYAESIESAIGREWWLMRRAVVAPVAGNPFWVDADDVSIRGDGLLRPPANTAAILVTDAIADVRGVTLDLLNTGSRAVEQNVSAPVILSDLRIVGSINSASDPAGFFQSEDADFSRISLRNVVIQWFNSGTKHLMSVGYGYPGAWDLTTKLGSVGLTASGLSDDTITAAKIATGAIDADALAASGTAAIATAWGVRIIGNGRTADMYLQGLTNKIEQSADGLTATLYSTDDTTPLKTFTITRLSSTVPGMRSLDPS